MTNPPGHQSRPHRPSRARAPHGKGGAPGTAPWQGSPATAGPTSSGTATAATPGTATPGTATPASAMPGTAAAPAELGATVFGPLVGEVPASASATQHAPQTASA